MKTKGWITYAELVAMGPWGKRHWQRLVSARVIKARKMGHRTVLINKASVEAYLGACAA